MCTAIAKMYQNVTYILAEKGSISAICNSNDDSLKILRILTDYFIAAKKKAALVMCHCHYNAAMKQKCHECKSII